MRSDVTLVIGDAHVDPRQLRNNKKGLRRFKWLNHLIKSKPEIKRLIIIGDFVSFLSLSHWDRDKRRKMELKRYLQDEAAANAALDILLDGINPEIELVYIQGNHEEWLERYLDYDPTMEGKVGLEKDLKLKDRGFKVVVPYKSDYKYKGVSFTHVPIMANGKPVGGKYATAKALEVYHNSVVFGHTHCFDVAAIHRKNSPSLQQAVNVGCFFEHIDEYAQGSMTNYWRGVLFLEHYDHNRVDIDQWSMGRLRRFYESEKP
jgi:hypothetical protein